MPEKLKCRNCRFIRKIEPSIINPKEIDVAFDLVDCILHNKTVILNDDACEDIKEKKKKS